MIKNKSPTLTVYISPMDMLYITQHIPSRRFMSERDTVLKAFNEKCRTGQHPFEAIFSTGPEQEKTVIRWCPICGTAVIDIDCDERTMQPGGAMIARRPKILELQIREPKARK